MRLLFTVTLFVGCITALSEVLYQDAFVGWMQRHQKSYSHDDFHHRYQIFRTNLDFIEESNAKEGSHKLAMNHLGDLTTEEFKKFYLGTRISFDDVPEVPPRLNAVYQNDTKDWRRVGAVTPVKNQAQCGSCWAFSATGAAEGCHYMKSKGLVSLSEQNLMDCSVSYGNHGCNGGLMENAFDYIIKNGGIDTEDSYPYTAKDGSCHYDPSHSAATLTKYSRVLKGDEGALLEALQEGPVAVAIDASQTTFHFYKSGVYDEPACSSTNLDHGVLAVGYGHEDGKDYWLVKNSWGETWGEGGYIKMARNAKNQCGIATMATLPHC